MSLTCRISFAYCGTAVVESSVSGVGASVQPEKNSTVLDVLIALVLSMKHL